MECEGEVSYMWYWIMIMAVGYDSYSLCLLYIPVDFPTN